MTDFSPSKFLTPVDAIPKSEKEALVFVCDWISLYTGLHFPPNKRLNLYRRLNTLCQRLNFENLNVMAQHLKAQDLPDLPAEVVRVTSTNHSFFFRESDVLDFFKDKVIPTLPTTGSCRIWSAAASSGEEAYTLAIILAETLGLSQALTQFAILGTDISYPMITRAESGIYHPQKLELVDNALIKRYFQQKSADQWAIQPMIKPMCTFRRMNLNSTPWPFQNQFHVVFCRNVLYYFDHPVQQDLIERIYDVTIPGGWLITSVTEALHWAKTRWRAVSAGVYRKL